MTIFSVISSLFSAFAAITATTNATTAPSSGALFWLMASISSLSSLISPVSATIYNIPCGDTEAFKTAYKGAQPGDVLILGSDPCIYKFDVSEDFYGNNPFSLGGYDYAPDDSLFAKDEGIIIRGNGKPEDTILYATIDGLYINAVFENLTFDATQASNKNQHVYLCDTETAHLFRNCILKSRIDETYSFAAMTVLIQITTLINSEVINVSTTPMGTDTKPAGIDAYVFNLEKYAVGILNTKVEGFAAGVWANQWFADNAGFNEVLRIFNSDLSSNSNECISKNYYDDDISDIACPIDQQVPNTKQGKNVQTWKHTNRMSEDAQKLPLRIRFPRVQTAGETSVYRLPSAYPEPKSSWSVITGTEFGDKTPQYYQFDSTAKLLTKKTGKVQLFFRKDAIDSTFITSTSSPDPPTTIVAAFHNGKKWRNKFLPMKVVKKSGKSYYRVNIPKRKYLNVLVAFFQEVE